MLRGSCDPTQLMPRPFQPVVHPLPSPTLVFLRAWTCYENGRAFDHTLLRPGFFVVVLGPLLARAPKRGLRVLSVECDESRPHSHIACQAFVCYAASRLGPPPLSMPTVPNTRQVARKRSPCNDHPPRPTPSSPPRKQSSRPTRKNTRHKCGEKTFRRRSVYPTAGWVASTVAVAKTVAFKAYPRGCCFLSL